jgi:hypothetical protein
MPKVNLSKLDKVGLVYFYRAHNVKTNISHARVRIISF